ncbi:asparagine synthase (glutamine-hydrolyzing) [Uliginosibacterium sp. 31-16]|uniref:asparagine synthase (glutamine-hydrolyzing) n=1 Tax=Uliginosibacterium sp. 31-16 TaxID=3068315 RepID=UPI00273DD056|nr:asparagine synthase (glutamine-hydrolyzing) [Uliginosibacterium sp. 31-16]MDP5238378.1 asparagine synthase (glutamine-hydrolyzing) [Uliginosibacterium sp. 31-16]
MCGFAGYLTVGRSGLVAEAVLRAMNDRIVHRGPDDAGYWWDEEQGIALGHRRLSILDLSPAGHQPMVSACARYVIAFNGEIYNHMALRAELEAAGAAPAWRGHSDTETLLAGCAHWGVKATLQRATGMFALALWDRETRELVLARDRIGEKPLYYGWQGDCLLFGSELKALKAHPACVGEINRDAITLLLRYNYIPAPHSIYAGISKLRPGCLLSLKTGERVLGEESYWDPREAVAGGLAGLDHRAHETAVDELERLLKDAVAQQMVADVPLGAFLSGGVDSSLVVALMQTQSARPVKTFTIGFNEKEYNEAEHAKAVARHLGTEHTELYVTPQQAMDVIPHLPELYDEPFSDASQIPTYLVSKLARQHVTVSLSGDAGDELFCGYTRYLLALRMWGKLSRLPGFARKALGGAIHGLSPRVWNRLLGPLTPVMPRAMRHGNIGDKLHKGARVLAADSPLTLYQMLISHWHDPAALVIGAHEPPVRMTDGSMIVGEAGFVEQMMALDLAGYLPDDILVKVDRAAMGVSLETRVPMLDHRVVEFAWRLPMNMKIRGHDSKWALRQVLYRHVPRELIERPKMGFGVPIGDWLRGPLRDWAEDLLDESRLRREGYLRPEEIRRRWTEHLSGRRNWQYPLWDVLMFQQWLAHEGVS